MLPKLLIVSDYRDFHSTRPEGAIFLSLAKMGFEIHIMTYKNKGYAVEFENSTITVIDFHPEKKFDKSEISKIRQYILNHHIDVVHAFNSISSVNSIQAVKKLNVKVALYRGYSANIHWWDPTDYIKNLHPRVDKIWCNSIGVEELFKRQLFFRKDKAVTVNKGHKVDWYKDIAPLSLRNELQIPDDALLLVNVAYNRRMKGIPYLLNAMAMLPPEANIHLLLIGRNMETKENLRIIKNGKLKQKVHLIGFRKDVLNIVASCDAFILPSIKGESITKSVIEAMVLNVTPIISDIRGNVELVNHGENGLIFPSKNISAIRDCILQVYNDRDSCQKMGKQAHQHIKNKLNHEQAVEKMKQFYLELCAS